MKIDFITKFRKNVNIFDLINFVNQWNISETLVSMSKIWNRYPCTFKKFKRIHGVSKEKIVHPNFFYTVDFVKHKICTTYYFSWYTQLILPYIIMHTIHTSYYYILIFGFCCVFFLHHLVNPLINSVLLCLFTSFTCYFLILN